MSADAILLIAAALKLKTPFGGINDLNLKTFDVTLDTTIGLPSSINHDKIIVTGSGILERADVLRMREHHVHEFLVSKACGRLTLAQRSLHFLPNSL